MHKTKSYPSKETTKEQLESVIKGDDRRKLNKIKQRQKLIDLKHLECS